MLAAEEAGGSAEGARHALGVCLNAAGGREREAAALHREAAARQLLRLVRKRS